MHKQNNETRSTHFPDWYWQRGLHDAQIRSVAERSLTPDYRDKSPKFNCPEPEIRLAGKQEKRIDLVIEFQTAEIQRI